MTPTTIEAQIPDLLLTRLAAFADAYPIPYTAPGIAETPPAETYLEATYLPNVNIDRFVGDADSVQRQGILQVTVVGRVGEGVLVANEIAGKVADHFHKGLILYGSLIQIRLIRRPDVAAILQDDDRLRVPVSIRYVGFPR